MDVDNLLALSEAATPGPWRAGYASERERKEQMFVRAEYIHGQPYTAICPAIYCDDHHEHNAAFIAAAREHFPELLRRWKRVRELLDRKPLPSGTISNGLWFSDKEYAELRELLDLPAEGK